VLVVCVSELEVVCAVLSVVTVLVRDDVLPVPPLVFVKVLVVVLPMLPRVDALVPCSEVVELEVPPKVSVEVSLLLLVEVTLVRLVPAEVSRLVLVVVSGAMVPK